MSDKELGNIITNFQISVEGIEYSDKGKINFYNEQLDKAITAIKSWHEKQVKEKYVSREEAYKIAYKAYNTHNEGEGGYCDTGDDMEWACRSECVDLGNKALRDAFLKGANQ